jgi:glutamate/tyrosine decarboxylase-like PLP-dependent enzyme
MSREPDATLQLTPDEMRRLGHAAMDLIIDHLEALPNLPATQRSSRDALEERLREPLPARGNDALTVLERVRGDVLGYIMHLDHPRFFGFTPSPSNFVSVVADMLAAGFNVFAGTWLESSAAAELELVTLD